MIFELSVEEANIILAGLSKMPYEASAGVIQKLQHQAQVQLPQEQPTTTIAEPVMEKKVVK